MKINCPKCHWQPTRKSLWICESKCKHVWHTFSTFGVCPKCSKRWIQTSCPACDSWSLHEDWYKDLGMLLKKELEKFEMGLTTKNK